MAAKNLKTQQTIATAKGFSENYIIVDEPL